MPLALTKSTLKNLRYGEEISFQWGLKGRPTKADPKRVVVLLNHRIKGIRNPKKIKLGTYPDVDIDALVRRASEYRALMDQGIDPRQQEANNLKLKADLKDQETKQRITLAELLEAFEADREAHNKGVRPRTVRDRRYTITSVFGDYLNQPVQNISSDILENIFKSYARENKRETGKKAIRYLNSLMNYAMNTKRIITRNPCSTFKGRISTTTNKRREALSQDECVALMEVIDRLTDEERRQEVIKFYDLKPGDVGLVRDTIYFYIAILLLSGLRKRELLNLMWKDVFLEKEKYQEWNASGPYFQLMTSKQDQPLGIPITKYMMGIFRELERRSTNGFVFPSPRPGDKLEAPLANERKAYPVLQKMLPEITKRLTAQLLRKTFATTAYGLGIDTRTIELMTGHYGKLEASNVAMDQYIAVNVNHHYQKFEDIHVAMLGHMDIESDAYRELQEELQAEGNTDDTEDFDVVPGGYVQEQYREPVTVDTVEVEPVKPTLSEQLVLFDDDVANEPVTVDTVEAEEAEPRQGVYGWSYRGIPNREMGPHLKDDPVGTWVRLVEGDSEYGERHEYHGFFRGPGGLILGDDGQPNYIRCMAEGFRLGYCYKDAAVGRGRNYDWEEDFLKEGKKKKKKK